MGAYQDIGQKIGETVERKQAAYGDSFGKSGDVMRILYPEGISRTQLDDALTVVRVLDKLFRVATDRDALGESPWRDIAGYALLSVRRLEGTPRPDASAEATERATLLSQVCQRCGELTSTFVKDECGVVTCGPCHDHQIKVADIMKKSEEKFGPAKFNLDKANDQFRGTK
jgi:hypothetical protein